MAAEQKFLSYDWAGDVSLFLRMEENIRAFVTNFYIFLIRKNGNSTN